MSIHPKYLGPSSHLEFKSIINNNHLPCIIKKYYTKTYNQTFSSFTYNTYHSITKHLQIHNIQEHFQYKKQYLTSKLSNLIFIHVCTT